MAASGIVTSPVSGHALLGAHESEIGRDDDARAGNVCRQHALAADVHVDLARAIGLAIELQPPVARNDAAVDGDFARGSRARLQLPVLQLQADRRNVRGQLRAADHAGQLGRLHRSGDRDVGVDSAVHVGELRCEHRERREIGDLTAHAACDRRLAARPRS